MVVLVYRSILLIAFYCGMVSGASGQWNTYTAKREVRRAVVDARRGLAWVATDGGLFSYRFSDGSYAEFTTSEGLRSIDLTAVTVDATGSIWIGAANGFLHRYDPINKHWTYVSDLSLSASAKKRINALYSMGDTLFILSDLGLSIYKIPRLEFGDTYASFGRASPPLVGEVTAMQVYDNRLWLGTRHALASTSISNPSPSAPESWDIHTTANGLPSNFITGLVATEDALYASTRNGLAFFDGLSWNVVQNSTGLDILDISIALSRSSLDSSRLIPYFITADAFWKVGQAIEGPFVEGPLERLSAPLRSIIGDSVLGTATEGILLHDGKRWVRRLPPGPPSNLFVGLAVDERGVLWSGSGTVNGRGFVSFDGSHWKSYTVQEDQRLGSNNYYSVSIGRNNAKWVSNWGAGVALLDDRGTLLKVFGPGSGLPSAVPHADFVVVGTVATDMNGVAWITARTPPGDTALVRFHPDSSLSYVTGLQTRNPSLTLSGVVIDFNGTKWFTNSGRFEPSVTGRVTGLFHYNEHRVIAGSVNGWGRILETDGLASETIRALAVDQSGELWIGTDKGISIIFDPGNPKRTIAFYHPLRGQTIHAIVVDPLNNKWIATSQGVFVLSPDGTSIVQRYTSANTEGKLIDDDIASIAIDVRSGRVFFGTEKGLSSLKTPAVLPNRTFDQLSVFPNPFEVPSKDFLTIEGLVQGSLLKILSVDGNVIREIRTPGGGIGFWDGRDDRGNHVPTGVYVIAAHSEDGSKLANTKVAVIRR